MPEQLCQYGSCQIWVPSGEGVRVTGGGYRQKFCCWDHAARWVLAMASRLESRETGMHARVLGQLEAENREARRLEVKK